jgi:hypothetical protein
MTSNPSHTERISRLAGDLAALNRLTARELALVSGISKRSAQRWIAAHADELQAVGTEKPARGPERVVYGPKPLDTPTCHE